MWWPSLEPKTPTPKDLTTYPTSLLGKALGVLLLVYVEAVVLMFVVGFVLCAIGKC